MTERKRLTRRGETAGVYSLAGSVIGIGGVIMALPSAVKGGSVLVWMLSLVLGLATVTALVASLKMLKGDMAGRRTLCWLYLLQLPVVSVPGLRFALFWPVSLALGMGPGSQLFLKWYAGSGFEFAAGSGIPFDFAGINLAAVLLLFLLRGAFHRD